MRAADVIPLAKRVFNELSGGERQRVIVAMALAQQPKLLLLDEPTAHLDIKYQIDILELVQRLNHERGVTVIAALHNLLKSGSTLFSASCAIPTWNSSQCCARPRFWNHTCSNEYMG